MSAMSNDTRLILEAMELQRQLLMEITTICVAVYQERQEEQKREDPDHHQADSRIP